LCLSSPLASTIELSPFTITELKKNHIHINLFLFANDLIREGQMMEK